MKPFLDGIAAEKFDSSQTAGFLIDRESTRQVEGRYVQKVSAVETLRDPFGKSYNFERTFFTEQRFWLRLKPPGLILFDSNSAGRILTGRLSDFSDFRISLENIDWLPENLLMAFVERFGPVRVYAATVDEIKLSPSAAVSLLFESTDDVRPHVRRFLKGKQSTFESLKIEFTFSGSSKRCELRKNGTVQIYGDYDPSLTMLVIQLVERFLSNLALSHNARKTAPPQP